MTRRDLLFATFALPLNAATARPNIVFILADDLGWGDLQCYNPQSKIATPNLDKLAAQGMRFTDAHTPSAVCSPTRYGVMTGRYPWRTRLKNGVLDGIDPPLIESGRATVAQYLKSQGYITGCFGKWHLGMQWTGKNGEPIGIRPAAGPARPGDNVDYSKAVTGGPNDVGFDRYYGISASLDMAPYCFIENRRASGVLDSRIAADRGVFSSMSGGVATKEFRPEQVVPAITAKAVEFIEQNKAKPFFLYVPLSSPHLPIVPNKEFEGKSKAGRYGDFVMEMDAAAGRILKALDDAGVASNTLVCFTSDNGGLWHWWEFLEADDIAGGKITPRGEYNKDYAHQSNAWMRGTKADIWEGGHRVPFIARWPGHIKPGGVSDALMCLTDFFATCVDAVGVKAPLEDSVSLMPAFRNPKTRGREHIVHHSLHGVFAIRSGDWKLVPSRGSGGFSAPRAVDAAGGQLYNIRLDRAESKNVYQEHHEVVARLTKLLERIRGSA